MKCSYNYPWCNSIVGFSKNSDSLFEMNIFNSKAYGVYFFKKFMCLDTYTKLVKIWHALHHDLKKSWKKNFGFI